MNVAFAVLPSAGQTQKRQQRMPLASIAFALLFVSPLAGGPVEHMV